MIRVSGGVEKGTWENTANNTKQLYFYLTQFMNKNNIEQKKHEFVFLLHLNTIYVNGIRSKSNDVFVNRDDFKAIFSLLISCLYFHGSDTIAIHLPIWKAVLLTFLTDHFCDTKKKHNFWLEMICMLIANKFVI